MRAHVAQAVQETLTDADEAAPGGALFVTVPFVWGEHEQPFDFRRYTTFGLRAICLEAGFTSVNVRATTGIFGTITQLFSAHVFEVVGAKVWLRALVMLTVCFPVQLCGTVCDTLLCHSGASLDTIGTANKL